MIFTTLGKIYLSAFKTNQTKGALGPGRGRVLTSSSRTWPYPPKSLRTWPKPPPPPPQFVCIPPALHVVSVKLHHLEWGHRQTLPPHCSLKKVNTWQKLTELKWDHWLFSRKGVTTHPSDERLIELAELHYSTSSFFTLTSVLCPPFLLQLTRLWHPKHSECRGKVCELGMKQFFQDHQEVSLGI